MGVKIPAAFEDKTGQVTRLTGELEFLVAATPGEALTADTPATTASFQPAGSTPVQAIYVSNGVTIADAASDFLTWDTLSDGTEMLDRTDPTQPTFLAAGTYAVTVYVTCTPITVGGCATASLRGGNLTEWDQVMPGGVTPVQTSLEVSIAGVFIAAAGDPVLMIVTNDDGAASHSFGFTAVIVKLA